MGKSRDDHSASGARPFFACGHLFYIRGQEDYFFRRIPMARVRLMLIALGMALALPSALPEVLPVILFHVYGIDDVAAVAAQAPPAVSGTWRSATDETSLTSTFDESVWGKGAKAIRTVEMAVRAGGDATVTVTRRVVDARGRTVVGSTSIERADLSLGAAKNTSGVRSELAVTVRKAERSYPDDKEATWAIDGLQVSVTTFTDDPGTLEVRFDFPEGRGSFWEKLRRGTQKRTTSP